MLSLFAASLTPSARPPAPVAVETLKELVQARESAVAEATALKNQRASAETAFLRCHLTVRSTRLAEDLAALEAEIARCVKADESFARAANSG